MFTDPCGERRRLRRDLSRNDEGDDDEVDDDERLLRLCPFFDRDLNRPLGTVKERAPAGPSE